MLVKVNECLTISSQGFCTVIEMTNHCDACSHFQRHCYKKHLVPLCLLINLFWSPSLRIWKTLQHHAMLNQKNFVQRALFQNLVCCFSDNRCDLQTPFWNPRQQYSRATHSFLTHKMAVCISCVMVNWRNYPTQSHRLSVHRHVVAAMVFYMRVCFIFFQDAQVSQIRQADEHIE